MGRTFVLEGVISLSPTLTMTNALVLDEESAAWIRELQPEAAGHRDAVDRLHALLLRAARSGPPPRHATGSRARRPGSQLHRGGERRAHVDSPQARVVSRNREVHDVGLQIRDPGDVIAS